VEVRSLGRPAFRNETGAQFFPAPTRREEVNSDKADSLGGKPRLKERRICRAWTQDRSPARQECRCAFPIPAWSGLLLEPSAGDDPC